MRRLASSSFCLYNTPMSICRRELAQDKEPHPNAQSTYLQKGLDTRVVPNIILTAHSSQLTAHSSQLTALSSQLSALSSQLSALSSQLSALSSQLSALSSQLSALKRSALSVRAYSSLHSNPLHTARGLTATGFHFLLNQKKYLWFGVF